MQNLIISERSRSPRYLRTSMAPSGLSLLLTLLPLSLFLVSCSDNTSLELQVANYAGEGRAWSWPNVNLPPFERFSETEIDSLERGLLGPPLSLGNRDLVGVAVGGRLVLIRNNRRVWSMTPREGVDLMPQLASDAGGQIYAQSVDAELFAVDTGGRSLWSSPSVIVDTNRFGLPLSPLSLGDRVVVGNTDGEVAAIDREGKELWKLSFPTKLTRWLASAGENGVAIAQTQNDNGKVDTLTMIGLDGSIRWMKGVGGRIEVGPICSGERVAIGLSRRSAEGKYRPSIALYDAVSGDELWRVPFGELPGTLALDHEENLYVAGGGGASLTGGTVASFGPSGEKRWEIGLRESVPTTLLVTGNTLCFVATRGRSLGVFSYTRDGAFISYAPIDTPLRLALPPTILSTGKMLIATREEGKMLRN